ncbi:MAG TPA: amino acid permease [Hyphomicrobium sp.]|nr:amino acid permease [Hyphomicrobium sp.]
MTVAGKTKGEPQLKRSVGIGQLTLYALGSMLGSGIYGLIGKAAGLVGNAVWLSFIVALVAALMTALSYASLGSRYPRAAGAAYVTQRAFKAPVLSFLVGLALVCSGLASVATQSKVFAANAAALLGMNGLPAEAVAVGFILITAGIVFRGIQESMWVNVVCTLIEASGLLIVIGAGMSYWGTVDLFEVPSEKADSSLLYLVMLGSVLTFFAFIGFEDTINVAEECKNPQVTVPVSLISATAVAALLYIAVAVTAVSVVPWRELAAAPAPLGAVMERAAPAFPSIVLVAITLFAVANTALVNYVTASRLIYGMSCQGLLPAPLGQVHADRQTPHIAVVALLAVLIPLALVGSITELASATVLLLLFVFAVVNSALAALKLRAGEPEGAFEVPLFVPVIGGAVCTALVVFRVATGHWQAPVIAGALLAGILVVYGLLRPEPLDD